MRLSGRRNANREQNTSPSLFPSALDAQISEFRLVLLAQPRFVLVCIEAHLMTHIHKLPAEILQHIFHKCCTDWPFPLRTDNKNSPILLLVQVCSRWRQLLLHAPMFWDNVTTSSDPSHLSLASLWLSRAGSLPRSLYITRCGATSFQSLIARFPFSRIDLTIRDDAEKLDLSEIPIESLLPLKRLSLRDSNSDSPQLSLGHHSFPNLSALRIWHYFDSFSALVTSKTIEELHIIATSIPISLCLEILRSATKLRELNLTVDDTETVGPIQDVVAPNLTDVELFFECYPRYNAEPLVSALTAPNLKKLMIRTSTFHNPPSFTCDVSSFLPKAGQSRIPELEYLHIAKTTHSIDIGILLRSIPSLRTLFLGSKTILDEDTMRGLASGEIGPRLRNMYLHDECIPFDFERILMMIESRRGLDIGIGNDSWGPIGYTRMIFSFAIRYYGTLKLDEYKQRISDLALDRVKVLFH